MSNSSAFTDVLSDSSGDTTKTTHNQTDSSESQSETTDDTVSDEGSVTSFADAVRPTLPYDNERRNDYRYEDPESSDKADDTDARGLFRQPSLNEIRYYAREGPYGRTIIEKPIRDAFKHGFEVQHDNTAGDDSEGKIAETITEEIVPKYKQAKIKSRRDGLCVLMHVAADSSPDVSNPIPTDGGSFEGFKLWTVDNISDELTQGKVADNTKYDMNQVYVSEGRESGGVAIVDDVSHVDHGEIIGYGVQHRAESEHTETVSFVHADRCHHFVNGKHVDGQLGNNVTGKHVGESVLTPVLQPLKASQIGFWAISQILLRYSAPLHAVEPPETWSMEDYDEAERKMGDISMASDAVLPPGSELSVAEGVSEFDPEPYFETLVKAICAGTAFTKPILEGTQTGTVTGSETSLKSYFSEIQVFRQQDVEPDLRAIVKKISSYDQSQVPRVADVDNITVKWGPLFKLDSVQRAEGAVSLVTAATNAIKNYVMTPDEARSLLSEEWAEFDIDVDLDELAESEMDTLDRININEAGQGIKDNEPRNNPSQSGSDGGRPEGSTNASETPTTDSSRRNVKVDDNSDEPTTDSIDELSTDELLNELQRRQE